MSSLVGRSHPATNHNHSQLKYNSALHTTANPPILKIVIHERSPSCTVLLIPTPSIPGRSHSTGNPKSLPSRSHSLTSVSLYPPSTAFSLPTPLSRLLHVRFLSPIFLITSFLHSSSSSPWIFLFLPPPLFTSSSPHYQPKI